MTARTVSLYVECLTHDRGLWCNSCLLSAGVRHWVAVSSVHGLHLQQYRRCHECGGHDVADDASAG